MDGRCDAVIIGGGVAGLWTRHRLRQAGYSVVVLEARALGAGQTIASQGILHSGVKYAFSGAALEASRELLACRQAWLDALEGRAGPDLRAVPVLADSMLLWSQPGVLGRLTGLLASRVMRSQVMRLGPDERPPALAGAPEGVAVWRVDERAIEPRGLLRALLESTDGPVVQLEAPSIRLDTSTDGVTAGFRAGGRPLRLRADAVVLAAGEGNEALLRGAGIDPGPLCQRRPLHMAILRDAPCDLFGHCIQELSDKPRLTITTVHDGARRVWYIGGDVAEGGVARSEAEQGAAVRAELAECLPWLDCSGEIGLVRIDRAEGRTPEGRRPDGAVVHQRSRLVAVWPTKLALAPRAAGLVADAIAGLGPSPSPGELSAFEALPRPGIAGAPWASKDSPWTPDPWARPA